jgi:hypothetical protein
MIEARHISHSHSLDLHTCKGEVLCIIRGGCCQDDTQNISSNWLSSHAYKKNLTKSVALVRERTILTERPLLVSEVSANFWGIEGVAWWVQRIPYNSHIFGFLDRCWYFSFQVAAQLYSRGWVDPVPDPLPLRKSGIAGNRTRTSGSVARNSDH